MAAALPLSTVVAVKNTVALARERLDLRSVLHAVPGAWAPRGLLWAAVGGELLAAIALFASDLFTPVLIRSLQLFLRF